MNDNVMLKVLWVDDIPQQMFINNAYKDGVDIENVICVNDGINKLLDQTKAWDAIILDANCKIAGEQEQASIDALKKALFELVNIRPDVPWFVYTAGDYEGLDKVEFLISDRPYDKKRFYQKPSEYKELLDSIKTAVKHQHLYKIKEKYSDICKFYDDADFLDLLVGYEEGGIETDSNIPNRVREVLDWLMGKLNKMGALPVLFNGTNLNECSVCLGMMTKFVPNHVQESFRFCVNIANEGSHMESRKLIRENKAPFLNKTLIGCLINAMNWCSSLSDDMELLKKESLESYTSNSNIRRYGEITKSPSGTLQLKDTLILNDKTLKVGDKVACVKYKNQDRYIMLAYI